MGKAHGYISLKNSWKGEDLDLQIVHEVHIMQSSLYKHSNTASFESDARHSTRSEQDNGKQRSLF